MTLEALKGKSLDELRAIATKIGIVPHYRAKPETLMRQILEKSLVQPTPPKTMEHKAEAPAKPVHNNTPEDVLEAIKMFTAKEGFKADFPGDGTWIFKYKGAEESGNLAIPLRVIKIKAENVSRGRRAPIAMPSETFDNAVAKGYANTVLMG